MALPDVVAQGHDIQRADRSRQLLNTQGQLVEDDGLFEHGRHHHMHSLLLLLLLLLFSFLLDRPGRTNVVARCNFPRVCVVDKAHVEED